MNFPNSDYRGYTLRKNRSRIGDLEAKAKQILSNARSKNEALKLLQRDGFSQTEASKLVQRFYRSLKQEKAAAVAAVDMKEPKKMSAREQQAELTTFTQNIHLLNQELHKNLRRNKMGIRHDYVEPLHPDYKRPPGFVLVPGLLGSVPGGDGEAQKIKSRRTSKENSSDGQNGPEDNLTR